MDGLIDFCCAKGTFNKYRKLNFWVYFPIRNIYRPRSKYFENTCTCSFWQVWREDLRWKRVLKLALIGIIRSVCRDRFHFYVTFIVFRKYFHTYQIITLNTHRVILHLCQHVEIPEPLLFSNLGKLDNHYEAIACHEWRGIHCLLPMIS